MQALVQPRKSSALLASLHGWIPYPPACATLLCSAPSPRSSNCCSRRRDCARPAPMTRCACPPVLSCWFWAARRSSGSTCQPAQPSRVCGWHGSCRSHPSRPPHRLLAAAAAAAAWATPAVGWVRWPPSSCGLCRRLSWRRSWHPRCPSTAAARWQRSTRRSASCPCCSSSRPAWRACAIRRPAAAAARHSQQAAAAGAPCILRCSSRPADRQVGMALLSAGLNGGMHPGSALSSFLPCQCLLLKPKRHKQRPLRPDCSHFAHHEFPRIRAHPRPLLCPSPRRLHGNG